MSDSRASRPPEATNLLEAPERDWVARIRGGDAPAFEALFHAYHAPLCAFANRLVGVRDLAEEIVQEVFLYIWERRETWDVRSSVKSYLFTAVRNAAMSYLRHERVVRQRTAKSRLARALMAINEWCRVNRHQPIPHQRDRLAAKLVGHYGYYGITGNFPGLSQFYEHVVPTWRKWLGRRGRRGSMPWYRFRELLKRLPLVRPFIAHSVYALR